LRNLYLEAYNVFTPHLSLWAGSRMYRGDDIYLLDYWPLDCLNTIGGGARVNLQRTTIQLHLGVNRLKDPFQYQQIPVTNYPFGAENVVVLDRQRTVLSLKGTQLFPQVLPWLSLKASLYGEFHHLPEGTVREENPQDKRTVPADFGWVAGAQLGAWDFGENAFVNFWTRLAGGLAAYGGDLAIPFGFDTKLKTTGAREVVLALSGNVERGPFGVLLGGYVRYFEDADPNASDPDDAWEYVAVARPMLFIHRYYHQQFELSYQGRRPDGLNPESGTHDVSGIFKFSVMPALSWDRGSLARPQLRLLYTLSYLNRAASAMFPLEDPRRGVSLHHFVGLQAEWWYNSSYR
jgi:maltoporin